MTNTFAKCIQLPWIFSPSTDWFGPCPKEDNRIPSLFYQTWLLFFFFFFFLNMASFTFLKFYFQICSTDITSGKGHRLYWPKGYSTNINLQTYSRKKILFFFVFFFPLSSGNDNKLIRNGVCGGEIYQLTWFISRSWFHSWQLLTKVTPYFS